MIDRVEQVDDQRENIDAEDHSPDRPVIIDQEERTPEQPEMADATDQLPHEPEWKDWTVGGKDSDDLVIEKIYQRSDNSIIYSTTGSELHVRSDPDENARLVANPENNKLIMEITHYTLDVPEIKEKYNSHIAHAYAQMLNNEYGESLRTLQSLLDGIKNALSRRTQVVYLAGATAGMAAVVLVYFFARVFGIFETSKEVWNAVLMGCLGGWVSIFIGLKSIKMDEKSSARAIVFLGTSRICYAMIAGVVTYYLILGKVALAFLKESEESRGYLVAAFFGGFSELFISNVMKRMGDRDGQKT